MPAGVGLYGIAVGLSRKDKSIAHPQKLYSRKTCRKQSAGLRPAAAVAGWIVDAIAGAIAVLVGVGLTGDDVGAFEPPAEVDIGAAL
jgi:hypothetical protein